MALAGDYLVVKMQDSGGTLRQFADGDVIRVDLGLTNDQHDVMGFGEDPHRFINGPLQAPVTLKGFLTTTAQIGTHTVISGLLAAGMAADLIVQVGQNAPPQPGDPEYSGTFIVERYTPTVERGGAVMFEAVLKPAVSAAPSWLDYEHYVLQLAPLFWLPMREAVGTIAHNPMYGADPTTIFQELFDAWTGDNPNGWVINDESAGVREVQQVGSGESHMGSGSGAASLWTSDSTAVKMRKNTILTIGDTYRSRANVSYRAGGSSLLSTSVQNFTTITGTGLYDDQFISLSPNVLAQAVNVGREFTLDEWLLEKIGELDGLIAGTTALGQIGLLGANEAFDFDGTTSILTVYNRASIQGLTEFSLWMLFKPSNAGENNNGTLFIKDSEFELRFNSASRDLIATVYYSTTNAVTTTSTTLSADAWHSVGLRIDHTNKTIDIFVDGVEASYASQQAGSGSRVSNTNNLVIGNRAALDRTLDALVDEAMLFVSALTDDAFAVLHQFAQDS